MGKSHKSRWKFDRPPSAIGPRLSRYHAEVGKSAVVRVGGGSSAGSTLNWRALGLLVVLGIALCWAAWMVGGK